MSLVSVRCGSLVTLLSDKTFAFSPECCYIPLSLAYKEQTISQRTNFNKVFKFVNLCLFVMTSFSLSSYSNVIYEAI